VGAAENRPLRVLLFGDADRLALTSRVVRGLGHVATEHADADVAIVAIRTGSARTLPFVERVVAAVSCPVVVCPAEADEAFIGSTAESGVMTCVVGHRPETWRPVIALALRPFADYQHLLTALRRRAVIERAKGVLMERYGTREQSAFELIRMQARSTNRRAVDVAQSFLDGDPIVSGTARRRATSRSAHRMTTAGGLA
jgi:two-component system, response regulator PdtaR